MMKRWVFFLLLVSTSGFAQNLLVNGDFEDASGSGWNQWWGGNSNKYASDPVESDNASGVWWSDDGILQGFPIGPGVYQFGGQLLNSSSYPLVNRKIVMRAEFGYWDPSLYGGAGGVAVGDFVEFAIDATNATNAWYTFSDSFDNTTAGHTYLNVNLFLIDLDTGPAGTGHYDNIWVTSDAPLNNPNYNGDNIVNMLDFKDLSSVWGQESESRNLAGNAMMDLEDLLVFVSAWLRITPGYSGYELVWSDEFDGTALNLSNWEYMTGTGDDPPFNLGLWGWGNGEHQYYTSRTDNVSVQNGALTITAQEEYYADKDYTSGRIRTANRADFLYGKIEARIKVPTGGGIWPAFWMMPTGDTYGQPYTDWAAHGEIDIMEAKNQTDYIQGTIHYGGRAADQANVYSFGTYNLGGVDFSDDFHIYSLEWEPNEMRWYVDGNLYSTKTSWWSSNGAFPAPFDQEFHILLNVSVGGGYPGCPEPDISCITANFPQQMTVDWVRVYHKTSN